MTAAFRSLSWGYHEPGGCVLWWQVEDSRALHIAAELAFQQLDESELVAQVTATDRALGIRRVAYTVGTPAIVSALTPSGMQGETVGDRLGLYGMPIIAADDDRVNGWKRCHSLLRMSAYGVPWLTMDPSCAQLIRAMPTGLRADTDPDDVRDPHPALTALRYGAMSRPAPETHVLPVVYPAGSPGAVMRQHWKDARRRSWSRA